MSSSIITQRDLEGDDEYYMDKMKEILEGFPNTGPPQYPGKLLDNVFIGNQDNAEDYDLLPALGITHVLNCAGTRTFDLTKSRYPPKLGIVGFLMLPAEDYDEFNIMQYFPDAIAFLDKARASGGKALVHCNLGVNRCGAICAAYLMVSQRKPLLKVISDLKSKRAVVLCNVGFRRQLLKYARCRGLLDTIEIPVKSIGRRDDTITENNEQRITSYRSLGKKESNGSDCSKKEAAEKDSAKIDNSSEENEVTDANGSERKMISLSAEGYNGKRTSDREDLDEVISPDSHSRSVSPYRSKTAPTSSGVIPSIKYDPEVERDISGTIESIRLAKLSLLGPAATVYPSSLYSESLDLGKSNFPSFEISSTSSLNLNSSSETREVPNTYTSLLGNATNVARINRAILPTTDYILPAAETYKNFSNTYGSHSSNGFDAKLISSELIGNSLTLASAIDTSFLNDSVHPLLAKPPRSYAASFGDNFKTTVKPKSYYYRKVAGKVPKYSDYEDLGGSEFIEALYDNTSSTSAHYSTSSDISSGRRYSAPTRSGYKDVLYPTSGVTSEHSIEKFFSPSPRTSASWAAISDYRRPVSSFRPNSASSTRSYDPPSYSKSYRPCFASRAGYTKDLDEDIESFGSALASTTDSIPSRSMMSRVTVPHYGFSSSRYIAYC